MLETPDFKFVKASVTLHFVEVNCDLAELSSSAGRAKSKNSVIPDIDPFSSFERDLLNYQNQRDQPLKSKFLVLTKGVFLIFPETYNYCSEGELHENSTDRKEIETTVSISFTRFKSSKRTIWHLTVKPGDGHYFTEYDLIKLSSFFGSLQEDTALHSQIRFRIGENAELLTPVELIRILCGVGEGPEKVPAGNGFPASNAAGSFNLKNSGTGIIQIIDPSGLKSPEINLAKIFKIFGEKQRVALDEDIKGFLKTLCGIILGIFDFERMDNEEIYDTIQPFMENDASFMVLCRGTLLKISVTDDEIMDTVSENIVISPYLSTPSALLAHNEYILSLTRNKLNNGLNTTTRVNLRMLGKIQTEVNEMINLQYLEDIFQYPSEQTIVEKGNQQRGIFHTRNNITKRMDELSKLIEIKRENLSNKADAFVTSFLGLIAIVPLNGMFITPGSPRVVVWIVYAVELLLTFFLYYWIRINKR